ncbi:ArsR/SmtB family transcription factor [Garicola koreensis]|uniref:ArsR family transcriptional regulator n=1 Tax=Garicola koreensis TaxID=1262554 RepID=A0A7W5XZ84_9MICC|nr:metalloregulator ArsR/SmtB family transcription factor [Garicola koreensis]MBB3667251.1 ArsR family transcriptional regulator [Garicola koreensis]
MTAAPEAIKVSTEAPQKCCSLLSGPLQPHDAERIAGTLKALADPTRLRVLSHVAAQGCDAVCACDLVEVLDISQPTISHHLKKLVEVGLLVREQRGRWAHYSVVREAFAELRNFLDLG